MTINGRTLTSVTTDLASVTTTEADFRQAIQDLATEASSYGKLPGGGFSNMQVFNTSGIWTKPADTDIKYYTIVIIGAGGGSSNEYYSLRMSGGGGGGAILAVVPASQLSSTESIVVGAGGAPGAAPGGGASAGGNGGSSGIAGKLLASGGSGAPGGGSSGGTGGSASVLIPVVSSVTSVGGVGGAWNGTRAGQPGSTVGASRWAAGGGGSIRWDVSPNVVSGGAGSLFSFWGIAPGAGGYGGYGAGGGQSQSGGGCCAITYTPLAGGPGYVMILG